MSVFQIKRGDTEPHLMVEVIDDSGNYYILGSNVTQVEFRLLDATLNEVFRKSAIKKGDYTLEYAWDIGDTNLNRGIYYGEFIVTFDDGGQMTVPGNGWIKIIIR